MDTSQQPAETQAIYLRLRRKAAIEKWLAEHEALIEATDAVQLTLHIKCGRDSKDRRTNDNVTGTVLHFPKTGEGIDQLRK